MIARGGRTIYGQTVGVLVLDTRFPRIQGDVANARTFRFPIRYKVVTDVTQAEIVTDAERAQHLLPRFVAAAQELEAEGIAALTTSCGFLSIAQEKIAAAVSIPVVTSSLLLAPLIQTMVGGRPLGIITAHAGRLSNEHLRSAGIGADADVHIRGMEQSAAFSSSVLAAETNEADTMDVSAISSDVVAVCTRLTDEVPDLSAILLECSNLQPYASAIEAATGLPVFGIYHLIEMLHTATRPPRFALTT